MVKSKSFSNMNQRDAQNYRTEHATTVVAKYEYDK